jgi:hypothetical protein
MWSCSIFWTSQLRKCNAYTSHFPVSNSKSAILTQFSHDKMYPDPVRLSSWGCAYEVRQFNSRNGPVKATFAYLCTSGCCHVWNILVVKLCALWDYGATVLKIVFWYTLQQHHVLLHVRNISRSSSFQGIFNFGKSQEL